MNAINKVSDITAADCADYLRLDGTLTTGDTNTLNTMIKVAKEYICNYTGIAAAALDDYADFVIVVLVLVQDMWDVRAYYVDTNNVNKVVDTILGMHSINLLPKEASND
jgi:hypothetical protein